ncbi:hypothetical protein Taro_031202, partial [Colocasia esculenta]|nr:hypothetical protein [Colocasia esculenta]
TDPAPLRRGPELDDGRETSSSLSPVGVGVGVNPYAANSNRHPQRPHPMPPSSCSQRPLTWTPTGQRPPLAANSN